MSSVVMGQMKSSGGSSSIGGGASAAEEDGPCSSATRPRVQPGCVLCYHPCLCLPWPEGWLGGGDGSVGVGGVPRLISRGWAVRSKTGRVGCGCHEDRRPRRRWTDANSLSDSHSRLSYWSYRKSAVREPPARRRREMPRGVAVASIARLPSSTDDPSGSTADRHRWVGVGGWFQASAGP